MLGARNVLTEDARTRAYSQSVLESVNYDQDRAIDVLLGMSDPNYVSSATIEEPVSFLTMCVVLHPQTGCV